MAAAQCRQALEVSNQSGDIRTSEFAVTIAIAGNIHVGSGRIHEAAIGWPSAYALEIANTISDVAAHALAVPADIANDIFAIAAAATCYGERHVDSH